MATARHGFRQVHLDFHTSPLIPNVGGRFNAKQFARTVKEAHVDSVTVFAKCHHGHLYFNTKHPARHPTLPKGFDLLRAEIDALHAEGIRAPIYLSVQCDEYAAATHPEWVAKNPDGTSVGARPLQPGWQILDMASPYLAYLEEQLDEVLERFSPLDGLFFDMCWNQPSVSRWAKARMAEWRLDPEREADRAAYGLRLARRYMDRLYRQVKRVCPSATVFFNSRPMNLLAQDVKYLTHIEIEALPTGGWGYTYFPINVRYARTFDRPYLGMTGRFHKSWADFGGLKPRAALKYEVCQMLAHGARCSVGDQMHPAGVLDKAAWELIGGAYSYAEACQPWCEDARAVAEIGVFREPPASPHAYSTPAESSDSGVLRALTQLKHQFNFLAADSDLTAYRLLILPDAIPVDAALARKLSRHLKAGGRILCSGTSGLDAELRPVLRAFPARRIERSPFTTTYMRFDRSLLPAVPHTDHVNYVATLRATPRRGAKLLGRVVEPYFERDYRHFSSHNQTPPAKLTRWPIALIAGRVGYIPFPVFGAYAAHASLSYRWLLDGCIRQLIGRPMVEIQAPSFVECSVMQKGKATVLHVLAFCGERRTTVLDIIEDEVPLSRLKASLALLQAPARAYLAPSRTPVEFSYRSGRAEFTIPEIKGHQMVVFE